MNFTDKFLPIGLDRTSVHFGNQASLDEGISTVEIPDAHLLFSGDFERIGSDLILSNQLHRVIVPDYFKAHAPPLLVSPDGAQLPPGVVDALTGHVTYAQATAPSPAGKVVGHLVKMTGSASIVRNGVTIVANTGDVVYQNDVVQTGSNSSLGLVLDDGTTFNLSANARFMLNDLTYDANSTSNSSLVTLIQGAASFVAGQVAKTGDMRVATPAASIGIRGTAVILDVAATDGKISISVVDQRDGEVHAVQVYNNAGVLIGTVTSNGNSLTLTPTATFEVIAQESNKSPNQVALEFNAFQQVLSTYDAAKQILPNLPEHTENKTDQDTSPNTSTKFAGSPPLNPPGTEYQSVTSAAQSASNGTAAQIVTVTVNAASDSTTKSTTTNTFTDPIIVPVKLTTVPFVVTPPTVAAITTGPGDHTGPVMSARGDVVYDPDGAIYFYDRATNTTTTIASPAGGWTYGSPTISSDGRYILYEGSNGNVKFVFVYGTDPSDPAHYHIQTQLAPGTAPAVSGDGGLIVVQQGAGNVAIYDLQGNLKGTITPAAVGSPGAVWKPAISADGHAIVFWNSDAAVPGGSGHLCVFDLSTAQLIQIANTSVGAGTTSATVSADGHLIAYQSTDASAHSEIYLYDINAAAVVFHTANASGNSYNPVLSPDGHFIVFTSDAQLTAGDRNAFADVYIVDVNDPANPQYKLVSEGRDVSSGGGAAISAAGQYVAFGSASTIFLADPTSGRSALILETATSPSVLTAQGSITVTGDYGDVRIGVSDSLGRSVSSFEAAFDSNGRINWQFHEPKSDFAALSFGQDATQTFIITLSADNGSVTIPVYVTVHNGIQPAIHTVDAAPIAAPIVLAQGQVDTAYAIAVADLLRGVTDIDGPSLSITSLTIESGGGSLFPIDSQTWTYSPAHGFSGRIVFNYTVSDTIKSSASTASLNIALPLAITAIAPDSGVAGDFITSSGDLIVSGTNGVLTAGEKIQVSSDNGVTWVDVAQATGTTWSLVDTSHHATSFSYQARVVDFAGEIINSASRSVIIDTAPPVVAITSTGGLTNQVTQVITGTLGLADVGAAVSVFDDGALVGGAIVQADGSWSASVPLHDGINSLTGRAYDVAGNVGTSNAIAFTLDTTSPTVDSIVMSGNGIANGNGILNAGHVVTVTVNFSEVVTVGGSSPTLTLDDGGTATYQSGSGTTALTFSYTVANGQNTSDLTVALLNLNNGVIRDAAGNNRF